MVLIMKTLLVGLFMSILSTAAFAANPDIVIASGNVVGVHDGDTININLPGLPDLFGKSIGIRLNGIDTPELTSSCATAVNRIAEKAKAIIARDVLASMVANAKVITLVNPERDKYFRIVTVVMLDGVSAGQLLIDKGLADPYDGGTKRGWCGR
jgi:micrococcal nuclease